jgi:hypothetical protein
MHASEQKFVYSEDSSWQSEMNDFFNAIKNNTPVPSGTTKDSLELMQTIEQIYRDGDCPGEMQ